MVNLIAEGIDNKSWLLANEADLHSPVLERYRQERLRHTEPMANKKQPLAIASNGFSEEAPFEKQQTAIKNGMPSAKPVVVKKKKAVSVAPVESSPAFGFE